jgi:hypothetical protein
MSPEALGEELWLCDPLLYQNSDGSLAKGVDMLLLGLTDSCKVASRHELVDPPVEAFWWSAG